MNIEWAYHERLCDCCGLKYKLEKKDCRSSLRRVACGIRGGWVRSECLLVRCLRGERFGREVGIGGLSLCWPLAALMRPLR